MYVFELVSTTYMQKKIPKNNRPEHTKSCNILSQPVASDTIFMVSSMDQIIYKHVFLLLAHL